MKKLKALLWAFSMTFSISTFAESKGHSLAPGSGKFTVNIVYKEAKPGDTLRLILCDPVYDTPEAQNSGVFCTMEKNGLFTFVVPVNSSSGYFEVVKSSTTFDPGGDMGMLPLLNLYFWEKSDSITVKLSNKEQGAVRSKCRFSGKGYEKYQARYNADSAMSVRSTPYDPDDINQIIRPDTLSDSNIIKTLQDLDRDKKWMSALSYNVLKADIIWEHSRGRFHGLYSYYVAHIQSAPDSIKKRFFDKYVSVFRIIDTHGILPEALPVSQFYLRYLYYKFSFDTYPFWDRYDADWIYREIKKQTYGLVRDRVMIKFFIEARKSEKIDNLFADARTVIHDATCLKVLNELCNTSPNKQFGNFALPDRNGTIIKLSAYKGKVVLLDFWFEGCGGCAIFYRTALSKAESHFRNDLKVCFISVNTDKSRNRWKRGLNSGIYTSGEAVNIYTAGQGSLHPLIIKNNIPSFPYVVLLDRQGVVKFLNSDNLFEAAKLIKAIGDLE